MRAAVCCVLAFASAVWGVAEVEKDEGVVVLTTANFQEVIDGNEFVLVEFYAPWCGHCKTLAPEYTEAAGLLAYKDSPIVLAKLDVTEDGSIAEEFEVTGLPTLKFFHSGKAMDYKGGRTAASIVTWLQKKTGSPAVAVATVEEAAAFTAGKDVSILGFFADQTSVAAKAYLAAASNMDDFLFAISSCPDVAAEYKIEGDAVLLLKNFDDGRAVLSEEITEEAVSMFVASESVPLVVEYNQEAETTKKIFNGDIKSLLLSFISAKAESHADYVAMIKTIATENKGKMLFVTVDTDNKDHKKILDFLGITVAELPTFRALKLGEEIAKFKPENNSIELENIKAFVAKFLAGDLKQHLMSAEIPEDWDKEGVKVLVGKNFNDVAMNIEKDVFVEFYSPSCGHCKQLTPIWDKLGEMYKDHATIIIAKMDITANDPEDIKVVNLPTIKLFKKGSNDIVEFDGLERSVVAFEEFLEAQTGAATEEAKDEL